jgi:hypothetical protein
MNWKLILRTISLLLLFTLMAACSNEDATPITTPLSPTSTQQVVETETPAAAETPTADVAVSTETPISGTGGLPVMGSGQCANAYYPVREGATWTYESTGSPAGSYSFTDTVTSVRDDGFTLTTEFEDLTRTQEWSCRPEGLVALELGGASAAAITGEDTQLELVVNNVTGVTYPNTIQAGDQWQHNLDFTGSMNIAGQEGSATGNSQTSFTAVGTESVTVPAGTFDAMKVQIDTELNITVSFQGLNVPVTFSGSYDYWFVQRAGWVKASGSAEMGGQSFSEMIELQAYNIP